MYFFEKCICSDSLCRFKLRVLVMSQFNHLFPWSPTSSDSSGEAEGSQLLGFEGRLEIDHECSRVVDVGPLDVDWKRVSCAGVHLNYMMPCGITATEVLQGCIESVQSVRQQLGDALAVFKIGITSHLQNRWLAYKDLNYTHFYVLYGSVHLPAIELLEAILISKFQHIHGCRNQRPGGEGSLHVRGHGPPFFCYIVGARADQKARIG